MYEFFHDIVSYRLFDYIPVGDVIIVVVCTLCALIIDKIVQFIIRNADRRLKAASHKSDILEAAFSQLAKPAHVWGLTVCCCIGLAIIDTPPGAEKVFSVIFNALYIITIGCVGWYFYRVANQLTAHFVEKAAQTEDKLDDMLVPLISGIVKCAIVIIVVLLILENLGVEITAALGSLGIGAAAIALASKDTLANLFGSIVVFFDRPFEIGDWIELNGVEGEVEEIRLRTTLIRTYDNSVVTMPNSLLTNACIDNFERRKYRRFEANFGVLYSTTATQIEQIVDEIKDYLAKNQDTYGPSYYVAFGGFGDSCLDIQVTAYTMNHGKARHMVDKQKLMFEIMKIVEKAGTGFAFPTRTIEFSSTKLQDARVHVVCERERGGDEDGKMAQNAEAEGKK